MILLINKDNETRRLFVLNYGVIIEEGVEIAECGFVLIVELFSERHVKL